MPNANFIDGSLEASGPGIATDAERTRCQPGGTRHGQDCDTHTVTKQLQLTGGPIKSPCPMMPLSDITGVAISRSDHIRTERELYLILRRETEGHCIGIHPA